MTLTPFSYINSINGASAASIMIDDADAKAYVSFVVNRQLSYFSDTAAIANAMNQHHTIPVRWQYDFLRHIVRKRARFSKWAKPVRSDDVAVIQQFYGYTRVKAEAVLGLLDSDQIAAMAAHNQAVGGRIGA